MRYEWASDPASSPAALSPAAGLGPKGWLAALREDDPAACRHAAVLRFALVNLVAAALLGAAWLEGWLDAMLAGDETRLVLVIAVVFAAGLVACGRRLLEVSRELDRLHRPSGPGDGEVGRYLAWVRDRDAQGRALAAATLKLRLSARIAPVRHVAASLVVLGLIGTVIGFIIALSGVEAGAAASAEAIGPMVSTLISGMSVALHTTLAGAILNIWLTVDYRLLEAATVGLMTGIIELGERHAER